MTIKIILFIILLILSGLFSGTEIVYSKVNKLRLEREAETSLIAKKALEIANNFSNTISTILIGNNLVNVAMSAIGAVLAVDIAKNVSLDPSTTSILSTLIVTVIIITFGEILPKTIFQNYAYELSKVFVYFIKICKIVFFPIIWVIEKLSNLIMKLFKGFEEEELSEEDTTSDELLNMTDDLEESGSLDEDDAELVRSAIEFTETVAWEIMTPRVDVIAYDIEDGYEKIVGDERFFDKARIILYKDTIDHVVGIVDTTKVLRYKLNDKVCELSECLYEPLYVHKTMPISLCLKELKESHKHLAIVLDEWGGMYGILTVEDILEELFGEIQDELDTEKPDYNRLGDNAYIVDGDMNIYDFFDLVEFDDRDFESDYSTVAGLCTELLDKLPEENDTLEYENLLLKINEVEGHRVTKVIVKILEKETDKL